MKLTERQWRRILPIPLLLLMLAAIAPLGCSSKSEVAATEYYCPMHPTKVSKEPGKCPICRMDLVPREQGEAAVKIEPTPGPASTSAATAGDREVLYWFDPMQPGTHFDRPGKSPFMDMELVPKYADEGAGNAVELSSAAMQAAGVATTKAERRPLMREIRAAGTIESDETRLARIAARVAGRLDRLDLEFTGQQVRRGAPIYSIYSPDLVTAQRELLLARQNLERARAAGSASYIASAESLLGASRDRLRLWGIDEDQIASLERGGEVQTALVVHSPVSGTVLEKHAVLGQYVAAGQDLYVLADLSRVWLQARVYEHELPGVRRGQSAVATLAAMPGREFRGRVGFIDPIVDPATRTARVRVELPNPDGALKPGMFANAELEVDLGPRLMVPRSALLDTGTRTLVYVEAGEGRFAGREVKVGERAGDAVEIVEGLAEGEGVVTAAAFLVDSQSQLQTGASVQWGGASEVSGAAASPSPTVSGSMESPK